MSPQGPPGDRAADEGSRAAGGRFPAQPCPTAQSVLWRPAVQELARPDSDATLIFVAQRALAAIEDQLLSAPQQALLGYLIGRLFESPGSGLPYLVVHGAVRVPQMIVADASERVVAQSLGAVQRMLPPEDGVVVGWYRSDPTGALKISASDHAAHTHHFPRPWQIALLVTSDPAAPRGGFFRPARDTGSPVPYLPFYELLEPESFRDGAKSPRVSWSTYWSPDAAVWRARAEPTRPPRVTPSGRPSGARRVVPLLMDEDTDQRPGSRARHGESPRTLGLVDRGLRSDSRGGRARGAPGAPSGHARLAGRRARGPPSSRSGDRGRHRRAAGRRCVPTALDPVCQPPDDLPRPGNRSHRCGRGVAGLHPHLAARGARGCGRHDAGGGSGGGRPAGGRRIRALRLPPALM